MKITNKKHIILREVLDDLNQGPGHFFELYPQHAGQIDLCPMRELIWDLPWRGYELRNLILQECECGKSQGCVLLIPLGKNILQIF